MVAPKKTAAAHDIAKSKKKYSILLRQKVNDAKADVSASKKNDMI